MRTTATRARRPNLVGLCCAGAMLLTGLATANAESAAELGLEGIWATGGSLVELKQNGETLNMIVIALEEPFDRDGTPLKDVNNPDEARHGDPILGLDLLRKYRFKKGRWQGKIYDPETGKTYDSRMKLNKEGQLEMRGYIGTPLLGKTKKFKPISVCREDMIVMLNNSNITGYCGQ
ncbi:MAG: DUF2147 domain-containing protein [Pseudomonadota bacterium]